MSNADFRRKSKQLQELLEETAQELGKSAGFVKRRSKLTAAKFVQTLILGVLENEECGLNEWVQVSEELGVRISEQGLHERLNKQAVEMLGELLKRMLGQLRDGVALPGAMLRQFKAIYLLDSTIVSLPKALQEAFPGFKSAGTQAAVKIQLCYDYLNGTIGALELEAGRTSDQSCTLAVRLAQPGSLHIQDLGYFDQDDLAAIDQTGAYFVSRFKYGTSLYAHPDAKVALNLPKLLQAQSADCYEQNVWLGARQRLPVRLVCYRLPQASIEERRRKAIATARKKGHTCPDAYLESLAWSLFITNTSPQSLSSQQIFLFYRLRWQIELIFKVWKSHARLDFTHAYRTERVLCSLYARLLALVIFHCLVAPFRVLPHTELSLHKSFQVLPRFALRLLDSFAAGWSTTPSVLRAFSEALTRFASKDARRKHPSSYRSLLDFP